MKTDSASSMASEGARIIKLGVDDPVSLRSGIALFKPTAVTATPAQPSSRIVFGSTFLTVFLAEFGDKTQLSILFMSAESQAPWIVFAGSAFALVATSLIGVLLGHWVSTRLTPKTVETLAGASMLLIAATLFWDVFN